MDKCAAKLFSNKTDGLRIFRTLRILQN